MKIEYLEDDVLVKMMQTLLLLNLGYQEHYAMSQIYEYHKKYGNIIYTQLNGKIGDKL